MTDTRRRLGVLMLAMFAFGALAACEPPEADTDTAPDSDTEMTREVMAVNPWVRVAIMPEGSDAPDAPPVNSAAYLMLQNGTDRADTLVSVETAFSDTVEIHTVTMSDGVMRMRPLTDGVEIPAGGEAVLEPGGFHIMLIGITVPLAEGDTVELTLNLASGRSLDVTAPVLRSPPE